MTYFDKRLKELTMEQLANVPPKETPLSKDEEDWAKRRMPVFDIGAEIAKETKIATAILSERPCDIDGWLWEKDVDLGWLGETTIQVYGNVSNEGVEFDRIMLGNTDIHNHIPRHTLDELAGEIMEGR